MIDHTGIGVADVGRSAAFYDEALGALGLRRVMQMPEGVGTDGIGYGENYPVFWIDRYHPHSVKQHTAFSARTKAEASPPSYSIPTEITLKRSIAATRRHFEGLR